MHLYGGFYFNAYLQATTGKSNICKWYYNILPKVRGLNTKLLDFYQCMIISDFEVVCITESWLSSSVANSEVASVTRNVYRADRRTKKRGGGVLIAILASIPQEVIDLICVNNISTEIDTVGIKIYINNSPLVIIVVYIPPNVPQSLLLEYLDVLTLQLVNYDKVIILGDFNVPEFIDSRNGNNKLRALHNCFKTLNMLQINNVLNEQSRILDLVAANSSLTVTATLDNAPILNIDRLHPPLNIFVQFKNVKQVNFLSRDSGVSFDYRRADFPALYDAFIRSNWSFTRKYY